jgi:hypothetical protein
VAVTQVRTHTVDVVPRTELAPAAGRRTFGGVVRSMAERPPRGDRLPTRRRGWTGRGVVGLVAEAPPQYLRSKEARDSSFTQRFFTGLELDGKPRTNATWFRWGTRQYIWSLRAPATNWVMWPRALRVLARLAGVVAVWAVLVGYTRHPALVTWIAAVSLWVALFAAGWTAGDSLLLWQHRRQWVWPLHRALVEVLHYHPRAHPRGWLWVPSDFRQSGLAIALPGAWTGVDDESERTEEGDARAKAIVAIVRTKLALGDIETRWRLAGDRHELVVAPRRDLLPRRVMFDESNETIQAWLAETPETAFLVGAGASGPVRWDLDVDSPHLLLSMLSGEGKSVLLRSIAAQALHRGAAVTVLDYKQRSQKCFKNLDDVHYCRHPENMHLAVVGLAMEGNRRNEVAWHWDGDGEPVQRRHLLVLEEANATIGKLQQWWDINRRRLDPDDVERYCGPFGDPSLPKSPAVLALGDLLFMGRQSYINVAAVGQYTTAHAMGGPEIREMFGARGIKGPQKAFAMLADDLDRIPKQKGIKGRIHMVTHGQADEVQVMFMTGRQARQLATTRPAPSEQVTGSQVTPEPVDQGIRPVSVTGPVIDVAAVKAVETDRVKLSDVASDRGGDGSVGRTLAALHRLRHTDPTFPDPIERAEVNGLPHWYSRRALILWHQNREDYRGGDDVVA